MLPEFASWEVCIVKNCDRGLENAFSSPRSQFFTMRTDPKPVNNLLIFFQALKREKTHANVIVTVARDRKIQTAPRINQIVGFVSINDQHWFLSNTAVMTVLHIG